MEPKDCLPSPQRPAFERVTTSYTVADPEPLAAPPITGKRWVLWRLRYHTGGRTEPAHQLRQSCVSTWLSYVVRRCPVRSLNPLDCGWLGSAGILDRIVWSRINPTRLSNSPYAAAAVYTPPNWASGSGAFTLYDLHW